MTMADGIGCGNDAGLGGTTGAGAGCRALRRWFGQSAAMRLARSWPSSMPWSASLHI
ncbi:hypothetical protein ABZ511_33525 [Nocardia gamkensis]|uniref:hypothetical protein n=1 Tax=Nocardia gamkensis TaxID=352869 RepID=UPI0033D6461A